MNIFENIEISDFPDKIKSGINKAMKRYNSGDIEGSLTSICGTIDDYTRSLYEKLNLENHNTDNFVQHVAKCVHTFQAEFIPKLKSSGLDEQECLKIWDHHKRSLAAASEVLAAFRRGFSDTHGIKTTNPEFVQISLNSAYYILRSLQLTHPFIPPEHPYYKISADKKNFIKIHIAKNIGTNIILNYPNNINEEFKKSGLSKFDKNELQRVGFLNQNFEISENGKEILKVIAKEL